MLLQDILMLSPDVKRLQDCKGPSKTLSLDLTYPRPSRGIMGQLLFHRSSRGPFTPWKLSQLYSAWRPQSSAKVERKSSERPFLSNDLMMDPKTDIPLIYIKYL
jgi:hypothetical protein